MTDTLTVGQELEGRILDVVRKNNSMTLEAMKVFTDAIRPVMSVIPTVTPPLAYDFAKQLVATERKFAEEMLHATAKFASPPAK